MKRETQIKTVVRHHHSPLRLAKAKRVTNPRLVLMADPGTKGGGESVQIPWRAVWQSPDQKMHTLFNPQIALQGIALLYTLTRVQNICVQRTHRSIRDCVKCYTYPPTAG